jgi:hypothetical protein
MFRLLPINDHHMSKRLAEINLQLKRKKMFVKCTTPDSFISAEAPSLVRTAE